MPMRSGYFLALLVLFILWPTLAGAGTKSYGTVTVSVEPPPQMSSQYGYAVYRMTVANRGSTARTVTVTLPGESWNSGDSISRLTRTVRVEPKSTAVAELLQPALMMNGSDARVSIDGQAQRDFVPVSLVDHMDYYGAEPILISRAISNPISASMDAAISENVEVDEFGTATFSGYSEWPVSLARADRPVTEWSSNWLAYSRYLMVMLSEQELRDAPVAVASALRDYVAAGGVLVVLGTSDQLPTLGSQWTDSAVSKGKAQEGKANAMEIGLGEVQLSTVNIMTGLSENAWGQWINRAIRENRQRAYSMDASDAERTLPMLESLNVPTRGLLAMMLLFTLLIGPGNILVLSWLKRRMWLLWTIPAIAFVFGGAVLAYSIFSEGIEPRAKTVAITLLDQTTRQSVTLGMTGYYAPLTPGDGLRFSEQTQVTAQVGSDYYDYDYGSGRPRTIDVSNGQHLSRGWIVARVPAHFDLRSVESRRERLSFSRFEDGRLTVVNGLGLPVKRLLVADESGQTYEVVGLAAGESVTATPVQWQAGDGERAIDIIKQYGVVDASKRLKAGPEQFLSNSTYVAFLDNASFAEPGLAGLTDHESTGIVIGRWELSK